MGLDCSKRELTASCDQEELPATDLVDQGSSVDGDNQSQDSFTTSKLLPVSTRVIQWFLSTYTHLLVLARDTSTLIDKVDVVGEQSVAAIL